MDINQGWEVKRNFRERESSWQVKFSDSPLFSIYGCFPWFFLPSSNSHSLLHEPTFRNNQEEESSWRLTQCCFLQLTSMKVIRHPSRQRGSITAGAGREERVLTLLAVLAALCYRCTPEGAVSMLPNIT